MAMCVLARSIKLLAKKMGLLDISGRIISCTKDSTKKIEFVDMADFLIKMGVCILDSGRMIREMVSGFNSTQMDLLNIKETGQITKL